MVTIISTGGASEIMERISSEMGMFLNDLEWLTDNEIKKLQAFAFLTCQLKRFNREELKYFDSYCTELIRLREMENYSQKLGDITVLDEQKDADLADIYKRLRQQFYGNNTSNSSTDGDSKSSDLGDTTG